MTDCIDREEHRYNLLIENMQVIRQTEQYGGSLCPGLWGKEHW